jgi:pyrimidine-nucleoside phosphorylase
MRAVDLIRKKRDGGALTPTEIRRFVEDFTAGGVAPEQMAAFAMAVFFRGLGREELGALTDAMMRSGHVVELGHVPGKKVDKHSTGGVGDKVSICLAPLVAAAGVPVPMISGRGLGHTGGTLDKLSAIPGFDVGLDEARFVEQVRTIGCALIGQTSSLAPADKKLYALRDVTGTVESIPLISASIMSKKLAEGIDALVLDVKVGSGAFMKTQARAVELADTMIEIGAAMGKTVRAVLTSMDDVLGVAVGNANETWEAIEVLRGRGPADLVALTIELGAEMLVLGSVATDLDDGRRRMQAEIDSGRGLEKLRAVVAAQGGDVAALDDRGVMATAPRHTPIVAARGGYVVDVDVEAVGRAAMTLGAGRARQDDRIDLGVGFDVLVKRGQRVDAGQPLVLAHHDGSAKFEAARAILERAYTLGEAPPSPIPLVLERRGRFPS